MKKTESKRVRDAVAKAMERYDYILETYEGRDFVQIVASIGGDVETVRYYDSGLVTMR